MWYRTALGQASVFLVAIVSAYTLGVLVDAPDMIPRDCLGLRKELAVYNTCVIHARHTRCELQLDDFRRLQKLEDALLESCGGEST